MLAALFALVCAATALNAATITVTSTADTGPDAPPPGTLRAALASAADGDTIDATGITGTITLMPGMTNLAELVVDKSVTILGPGPTNLTVDANHLSRVFLVRPGHTVTIEGLRIVNGEDETSGGGIHNDGSVLTVSNCTLSGNSAQFGGGIFNFASVLTVDHSTISGNSGNSGGGILNYGSVGGATLIVDHSTISGNSVNDEGDIVGGGGIFNFGGVGSATLTVRNSTLSGNSANSGDGGGIRNSGLNAVSKATATIANSTLSGNSAHYGGAIYNDLQKGFLSGDSTDSTVTIGNCTLSGNLAVFGGAIVNDDGDATVLACTFSGNSASFHTGGIGGDGQGGGSTKVGYTILKHGQGQNLNGDIVSLGFNLSSDNGAGFLTGTGDQINKDPRLGPLADNGGSTLTHLPLAGSPALDRGSSDLLATLGLTTDQRGLPRIFDDPGTPNAPFGDGMDIGALEIQQPTTRNLVWTNLAGGDWNVASNWNPNFVPGTSDNAIINVGATVTVSGPAVCFGLTLGSSSNSPTLTGGGTLTLHGPSAWINGTMSGTGRTVVEVGSTLNIANASGAGAVLNTRTLENRGTILWSRSLLGVIGGAVITNGPGALFQAESPAEAILGGGIAAGRIDNAGDFRKVVGSGPLTLSSGLRFNNSGTVAIEANLLVWSGGLTNNGAVILSPGTTNRFTTGGSGNGTFFAPPTAVVEWNGGTFTLDSGAQLNGDGLYRISSPAIVAANASFVVSNLDVIAGTLGGAGTVTIANVMNLTGGGMSGGGRTIIPVGATLNASLPSGGGLNARTLENAGTVVWTGAGNIGFVSAVITNRAGAVFLAQGSGGMTFVSGPNRFDNAGTFRKSVHTGSLDIVDFSGSSSFNNFGTVEIQTGTLLCGASFNNQGAVNLSSATTNRLAGGGSVTGMFAAPANALVEWTGGTFTLNPGAQLNGPGLYRINGVSANVVGNGNVTVQNFDLVSGSSTLSGTGALTIAKVMNWTAGTMDGSGRTIIPVGATLNVGGPNGVSLKRTLENGGNALWTDSGAMIVLNGVITNRTGALFHAQNDALFFFAGGVGRFDNAGTFRKSVSTGSTTVGVNFNNSGTVDIRSGILAANGGYVSSSSALLNCALGGTTPGTNYGQLQVAGTVTLNGGLSVDLLPGFTPATNDTFTVVTAGSRSGAFVSFFYPSNQVTMQLSNTPNSVILRVGQVFAIPHQPTLLTPELASPNIRLIWTATSNVTYRLESNPNLSSTNWTAVPGDVTTLSNTASKLDTLTPSNRLYRVRVLP